MNDFGRSRHDWSVVVADDNADWRMLLALWLRRVGYVVREACDGIDLIERCSELGPIEGSRLVVVSDIDMPGRTGIEAANELRAITNNPLVLFVTGTLSVDAINAAWATGASEVLRKPVSEREIVATVDRICRV